jgi:hypothetical protein
LEERLASLEIINRGMAGGESFKELAARLSGELGALDQAGAAPKALRRKRVVPAS